MATTIDDKLKYSKTLPDINPADYIERFKPSEAAKNIFAVPENEIEMRHILASHYTYRKVKSEEKNDVKITVDHIDNVFEDKKAKVYGWTIAHLIQVYNATFKSKK
jgi:hypothetical protein